MRRLIATICLTFAVLLGSAGEGWNEDYHKGWDELYRGEYTTALKSFTLSAEQGNAYAQYSLGYLYEKGWGVPQDNVRAFMWYNISASQGYKYATTNRDVVAKDMTPPDISTAQKLARECVRKKYKGC